MIAVVQLRVSQFQRKFPQMPFAFIKTLLQEYNFLFVSQCTEDTYTVNIIWIMK